MVVINFTINCHLYSYRPFFRTTSALRRSKRLKNQVEKWRVFAGFEKKSYHDAPARGTEESEYFFNFRKFHKMHRKLYHKKVMNFLSDFY